jgi:hypothetical protein
MMACTSPLCTVKVTPVNDPPVAAPDGLVTSRDVPATIDVLANDTDVDGDQLAVSAVTPPGHGSAAFVADGSVTYTPALDYTGPDSFDYSVIDGAGGSATAHVDVMVVAVNHAPVAGADVATTAEDTATSIDVLANDTDADGGVLTAAVVTQPLHGSATMAGDGNVLYQPAPDYHGPDAFDYAVAGHRRDRHRIRGDGDPVNDAPVAVDDTATTPETRRSRWTSQRTTRMSMATRSRS